MSNATRRKTNLSTEEKRALLEQKLRTEVDPAKSRDASGKEQIAFVGEAWPPLTPDPDGRFLPFPLTDIQQAYLLGRIGGFELGGFSVHEYIEVDCPYDETQLIAFNQACQRLIERHDMLRAVMLPDAQQRVLSPEEVPAYVIPSTDLTGRSEEVVQATLAKIREEMSHEVIDTYTRPAFNIRATRIGQRLVRLHFSFDMLMLDASGLSLLYKELFHLIRNPEAALPPLALTFRDYVLTLEKIRDTAHYEQARDYWFKRLDELPPAPELPLAVAPRTLSRPRFRRREYTLSADVWRRLKDRGTKANLTASGFLFVVFAEILTIWSTPPHFTLNLTQFDRLSLHPRINDIVGDFTSPLLVQVDNTFAESFERRAGRIQEQLWKDLSHNAISAVEVLRELTRRRGGGYTTMPIVFTSMLWSSALTEGFPEGELSPSGWLGEFIYNISQTPQVWIDHQVFEYKGELVLVWDCIEALFPAGLLDDMFGAYRHLLELLATDETAWQRAAFHESLLAEQLAQRARVNDTAGKVSQELLHDFFIARALEQPDAPAIIAPGIDLGRTLTYGELLDLAKRSAHWLQRHNVGPNTLVAVVMEKGWEQIVAVLGILMAGGAYLPIDAHLPAARRNDILADGKAHLALTQPKFETLEWPDGIERLAITEENLAREAASVREIATGPEDLAYVLYTSGSTGRPKGVMLPHRGPVNTILDVNRRFSVTEKDRALCLSALNFDLSVYDVFGVLAAGGALVMPEHAGLRDPAHWREIMAEYGVTLWNSVPALKQMLVEYLESRGESIPPGMRLIMMSGDWIPLDLPGRIRALWPKITIVGLGGPTETSIWNNHYLIEDIDPAWKSIPYGKPLANQTLHVLDVNLEPHPVWVTGDLYIGGRGLARGYWGDEEKTNERFIVHPATGERLYKSGDLARYLPDGNLEIMGRSDFQVKIRGHRIELKEIEAVLTDHPAIKEAVVTAVGEERSLQALAAYIVPAKAEQFTDRMPEKLKEYVGAELPEYMIPATVTVLDALPLSPNGKVDRKALPAPDASEKAAKTESVPPGTDLEKMLAGIWAGLLDREDIGIHDNFFEGGGDSMSIVRLQSKLRDTLGKEIPIMKLFEHPTISTLARHLGGGPAEQPVRQTARSRIGKRVRIDDSADNAANQSDVAIIGMSCRFPGARNVEEFWQNLRDGVESITFFSDEELLVEGIDRAILEQPNYVKAGGILPDIDRFDAGFFGFTPREAQITDPQERIFLEGAWEALEDAGYTAATKRYSIGVYAGANLNFYAIDNAFEPGDTSDVLKYFPKLIGNDADYVATRVSYELDLKGPGMGIATACSSALVAVHVACQSVLNGESDMALAGAVGLILPRKSGYFYYEDIHVSSDGHCRAFDAESTGTVFSNGIGVVVLKRLTDALADGDVIHAVIKGSAINNDGAMKVGYTAPSVEGQANVIADALAAAGVKPKSISYVETHGTGTRLGDPIEAGGLALAFGERTENKFPIGAVKSNIGHTGATAGIAGLIKTVLALKHQQIPPSLHFKAPNPHIDFASSPFYVNTTLADWKSDGGPRRAGVSSFGIGGTNAHMVLEEAPVVKPEPPIAAVERPLHLLMLSAKSEEALNEQAVNYENYLKTHPEIPFTDVCFTAATGRSHFEHRLTLVADSSMEAGERLRAQNYFAGKTSRKTPKIAFLFTGQGSEYPDMGRQLFETQPLFRKTIQRCDAILRDHNVPLLDLLYPDGLNPDLRLSTDMAWLQPVLFSLEYALARLWQSWGVVPDVVMGHSIGEYVAACVAGVFSLEDGLKLVANRGSLMQSCPEGRMLAVSVSEEEALEIITPFGEAVSVSVINAPDSVVLSGKPEAIESILVGLTSNKDIKAKLLPIPRASHSPLMEPALAEFGKIAQSVAYARPGIPLCSNVTGAMVTIDITSPEYWVRHLRQPVHFAASVKNLYEQGIDAFLEIGPKPALLGMAGQCLPDDGEGLFLPTLREGQDDWRQMLETLGQWYIHGGAVDWQAFDEGYPRRKAQLPTYPFQRQRYWVEKASPTRQSARDPSAHPLLGQKLQLADTEKVRFDTEIGALSIPWLVSHRVFDAAAFPATGYLEMALAAGADVASAGARRAAPVQIQNITFEQALILPEEETATIQLVLSPEIQDLPSACASPPAGKKQQHYRFQVFSLDTASQWISHVTGQLMVDPAEEQPCAAERVDLAELLSQCPTELSAADQYQAWRERGVNYGADFQGIQQLFRGEGMAMGKIDLPEALFAGSDTRGADNDRLHPALFDACLQVMMVMILDPSEPSGATWVPTGMKKVRVYRAAKTPLWSVARIVDSGEMDLDEQSLTLGISVFDESGVPIARIEELVARRIDEETLRRYFKKEFDEFYAINWAPAPSPEVATSDSAKLSDTFDTVGSWLVFADSGGVGEELAEKLEEQGNTCILAYPTQTSSPQGLEGLGARADNRQQGMPEPNTGDRSTYYLDPANPTDFQRLFAESFQEETPPLRGIIHLWGLDAPDTFSLTTESLTEAQIMGCGSVLHLLQAQIKEEQFARLWLVTRNAVNVGESQDSLALAQVPLWGIAKTISVEHPELWGGIIDNPTVDELLAEIAVGIGSGEKEDQVAYRAGERHLPRLVKTNPFDLNDRGSLHPPLQPDHCYLVTGGLGSLGLKVARWMVEQGVRHLVLMGRSGLSDEAQALLEQLEETGAKILVVNADISDAEQVRGLLEEIEAKMPPLKGIVHAAGLITDGVLQNQNIERFQQIMAPKVFGTWNLHTLTRDLSLDFFVCFSSIASIVGSPGIGTYGAANIFMDALIHFRRSLGLPGLSINWGLWADSRMGTVFESHHTESGVNRIEPEEGLSLLGRLMGQTNTIQVGIFPMTWPQFFKKLPEVSPFFSELVPDASSVTESVAIKHRLAQAPEEEYEGILIEFIRGRIANVLRTNPSLLDMQQPLNTMGLDSLMAVELRNRIRSSLDIDVPMAQFMGDGSILDLTGQVGTQIKTQSTERNTTASSLPTGAVTSGPKEQMLARLKSGQLSEEEMDALLQEYSQA